MDKGSAAIIAGKKPIKVVLEAGKNYSWCRCGRSAPQPFCDGSHRGTSMSPLKFTAERLVALLFVSARSAPMPLFVTVAMPDWGA